MRSSLHGRPHQQHRARPSMPLSDSLDVEMASSTVGTVAGAPGNYQHRRGASAGFARMVEGAENNRPARPQPDAPDQKPPMRPHTSRTSSTASSAPAKETPAPNPFFNQILKGWEELKDANNTTLEPWKRLNNFQLFSTAMDDHVMADEDEDMMNEDHPLAPPALTHTLSTPVQHKAPSVFLHPGHSNGSQVPPPIPLNPFQRSSSTPSAFRTSSANSAFGTVHSRAGSSVYAQFGSSDHFRKSAFERVQYYTRELDDMERTSIEVSRSASTSATSEDTPKAANVPRGAASRAKSFLSRNVPTILRRTRRQRNTRRTGRENPVPPAAEGTPERKRPTKEGPMETTVTVVTHQDDVNPNDSSFLSQSSEVCAILKGATEKPSIDDLYSPKVSDMDARTPPTVAQHNTSFQEPLDWDVDEEELQYQKMDTSPHLDSPNTIPSPAYHQMTDSHRPSDDLTKQRGLRLSVPSVAVQQTKAVASPTPMQISSNRDSEEALTPRSQDSMTYSPQTMQSNHTGSSSGHTTQAASTSSGPQSGLSTISETDREVMLANKEGKRRRGLQKLNKKVEVTDASTFSSSANSQSTNPHGYVALQGSPIREGAAAPSDRYFMDSPESAGAHNQVLSSWRSQSVRSQSTASSKPSGGSSVISHTSSSASSREEQPPTFVSYLNRLETSDLMSMREESEASSRRPDGQDQEEREGSPADFGYQPMMVQETMPPAESQPQPVRPLNQKLIRSGRLDKFRSRPPRSPFKGGRLPNTPPPRGPSPYHTCHLSPPRNIVDHHPWTNVSKPWVTRTARRFVWAGETDEDVAMMPEPADEHQHRASPFADDDTCNVSFGEGSIEIMKSDSKDEVSSG